MDIANYFLLFIVYSFLGWLMEVATSLVVRHKFINRGFMIGPYCPIHGTGAVLITVLLSRYYSDPIALFIMASFTCATLEYIISYAMEKLFKARWWDYSNKLFNINGRICLKTSFIFGLLGCLIIYVLNPFIFKMFSFVDSSILNIIAIVLCTIFVIDFIVSFIIIFEFRSTTNLVLKDSTEDIAKRVKDALLSKTFISKYIKVKDNNEEMTKKVKDILMSKSILTKRLINAYPNLKLTIKDIHEKRKKN